MKLELLDRPLLSCTMHMVHYKLWFIILKMNDWRHFRTHKIQYRICKAFKISLQLLNKLRVEKKTLGWACLYLIWKNKEHFVWCLNTSTQKQSWLCKSHRRLTPRNSASAAFYAQEAYKAQFCENTCLHKFWNLIIMP